MTSTADVIMQAVVKGLERGTLEGTFKIDRCSKLERHVDFDREVARREILRLCAEAGLVNSPELEGVIDVTLQSYAERVLCKAR